VTDWIVRSKLIPSVPLREFVQRRALIETLNKVVEARAGIVHAAAGCGKSTLLAQWRESLCSSGIPVAWLSLDEYDTDPFQFLTYLVQACREGGFADGFESQGSLQGFSGSPTVAICAAIVTALGKCRGPHVIILDDFHRADTAEICEVVDILLAGLPADIHLVISTREYPSALALADLRAREVLVVVAQSELRFSAADIRAYLGSLVPAGEQADWATELFERTDGWPIALQTVRRWLKEGASLSDTLQEISGRSSDLVDYFLEQVFRKLDPDEQRFLLRTSILERMNGELGDLLCGRKDSWAMLERLERRDLFVNALDRDRAWYGYHRLFSEFLQERLRRQSEAELQELHALAAEWFRRQGHAGEAVQHALRAGQPDLLAGLLESVGGWHYALQGHVGIVQQAVERLGPAVVSKYPRVWLARIFLTVRLGDLKVAESEFCEFAASFLGDTSTDKQLQCEGRIMDCLLGRYGDRDIKDTEILQLEQVSEILPNDNNVMNAACFNLLCAMHGRSGRLDEAMAAGDQAIFHFRRMGSQWGEVFIYFHEGCACMTQARLRDAEALYREGYQLAVENFGEDHDSAAIGRALLAEVAYEKNNLHEAGQLLEHALDHIERFDAWFEVYLAAYSTAIKLARARRDKHALVELVRRARSTAANRGLGRLARAIDAYQLDFRQHDRIAQSECEPTVLNGVPMTAVDADPGMRHLEACVAARGLILAGTYDKAAELLQAEADEAHRRHFIRSFITLSLLLATARWKQGRHGAAVAAFEAALSPALFEGLKRPFIDEGDLLIGVIGELSAASEERRGNRLRDVFLTELIAEIQVAGHDAPDSPSELSRREQEVMRFLIQGRSNREIADAMVLSVNTVKFHLKNVFDKLRVGSRKDAVSAAIRRRLL
jgi:LuxR family maltose regulon positive regulatory protein